MAANSTNALIDRLKTQMNNRKVKVPQLEAETGIPKDRIYKWFQNNSKISADDAEIITKWLAKELENIPEKEPGSTMEKITGIEAGSPLERVMENLSETNRNLSETERINARTMERLVTLLELKLGLKAPELAPSGTPGTEHLGNKKKAG